MYGILIYKLRMGTRKSIHDIYYLERRNLKIINLYINTTDIHRYINVDKLYNFNQYSWLRRVFWLGTKSHIPNKTTKFKYSSRYLFLKIGT